VVPKKGEYFGLFPLNGIIPDPGKIPEGLFERAWTLVSASDIENLERFLGSDRGFKGNMLMARERLEPNAFLVVKQYLDPQLNYLSWLRLTEVAEQIAAGINLAILLSASSEKFGADRDGQQRKMPTPVWLPSMAEHCELPMVFDRNELRMSGHSSQLGWPELEQIQGEPPSNENIDDMIEDAPVFVTELINGRAKKSVENAARALIRAFNCTSIGQFTAQCLSVLDILFGENGTSRWQDMLDYVNVLCVGQSKENTKDLFDIRHKFVHRHLEPYDKSAHIKALAVTVTTISLFTKLSLSYPNHDAKVNVLKACKYLDQADKINSTEIIRESISGLLTLDEPPKWAREWINVPIYSEPIG